MSTSQRKGPDWCGMSWRHKGPGDHKLHSNTRMFWRNNWRARGVGLTWEGFKWETPFELGSKARLGILQVGEAKKHIPGAKGLAERQRQRCEKTGSGIPGLLLGILRKKIKIVVSGFGSISPFCVFFPSYLLVSECFHWKYSSGSFIYPISWKAHNVGPSQAECNQNCPWNTYFHSLFILSGLEEVYFACVEMSSNLEVGPSSRMLRDSHWLN